jgi:hypothetical protein
MVTQEQQVLQALKAQPDLLVLRERRVLKVVKVLKVQKEQLVLKGQKALRAQLGLQVMQALKVITEQQEVLVLKAQKDKLVVKGLIRRDQQALKDQQVHKVLMVLKGVREILRQELVAPSGKKSHHLYVSLVDSIRLQKN